MNHWTAGYLLEKDGVKHYFQSEKEACEFLGVKRCSVSSNYRYGSKCKGYIITRIKSENEKYRDKRLHKIWESMHERCEYKKHKHYKSYGGRGIKVCEEWKEYISFAKWSFENGYYEKLTIDRIDVNGNYEPSNCRWITMKEQHNNTRKNRFIVYKDNTYTLSQLAETTGILYTTLRARLNNGWSVEKAVETPVRLRISGARMKGVEGVTE